MCGAAMVAGMVYGDDTGENREAKSYTYKKVQEIAAEFKKTNPSIICRELLGLSKNCAVTPNAEKRTAEYYKKTALRSNCGRCGESHGKSAFLGIVLHKSSTAK